MWHSADASQSFRENQVLLWDIHICIYRNLTSGQKYKSHIINRIQNLINYVSLSVVSILFNYFAIIIRHL